MEGNPILIASEFSFSERHGDERSIFIMPSESSGLMIIIVGSNRKKAAGNPYPKRGQIKKKIIRGIAERILSASSPVDFSVPEAGDVGGVPATGKGNPYPRRGQIKGKLFKELFKMS